MRLLKYFSVAVLLATPFYAVQAEVTAYSGKGSAKLYMEAAPELGKDVYLLKFEGISSSWAGKVIRTEQVKAPSATRYTFEYEVELSSGKQTKDYSIVVEAGKEQIKGSAVPRVKLYYPHDKADDPVVLHQDEALTEKSKSMDLAAEYKKSPFKPEVD
jgi:hypothetical protein